MSSMSRSEFLGLGGLLAGTALGRLPAAGAQRTARGGGIEADLIVVNARVYAATRPCRAPRRSR